jgi:tRNA(Ile)-lysidine synthase
LLDELRSSLGHDLAVGHVDHGTRPDAQAIAEGVRKVAGARGLVVASEHMSVAPGAGFEARARTARYDALERMRTRLACTCIATAHHADDQAETFLLRAGRGAGLDALAGIRSARDGTIVRPLLGLDRQALLTVVADAGLDADLDPANLDQRFTRNRLRHTALPALEHALPGAAAGFARTASAMAMTDGALDAWVGAALADSVGCDATGAWIEVPHALVPAGLPALAALVRHIARRLQHEPPSQRGIESVWHLLRGRPPTRCRVAGLQVERTPDAWRFARADVAPPGRAD